MTTLLLRLAAPLQSWGGESKYEKRMTNRAPSKSGVIGLAAAALGRRRDEPTDDLLRLRFGCRTDREGALLRDFQTTIENGKASHVIVKHYLSDAVFLAGLEGDEALLCKIADALQHPVFPLFLGRRSCPPAGRILLGLRDCPLKEALSAEPRLADPLNGGVSMRIQTETADLSANAYFLRDSPVSYNPAHRTYGFRRVHEYFVPCMGNSEPPENDSPTVHDPMAELEVQCHVSVPD